MDKLDLVGLVKEEFGNDISDKDAKYMIEGVFKAVVNGLKNDGLVKLHKFGIFSIKDRSARVGRNPRTGDSVKIPASITVKFKASPVLKDAFEVKKPVKKATKVAKVKEAVVEKKAKKAEKSVESKTSKPVEKAPIAVPKTTKKGRVTEKSA